ncbi:thioredoxin domain-containing protein [Granulicella sibirica]|uniref:Thymidylate kinase n=1 Tax=Granulicella sibirica TaxID=2479048 RepID=A0A4Q0SZA7_9BACT|nr:thioredoxin domain-containing protein [Granulicella sibirica]RXH56595.1 Thymidylate kinase [Granulicella sibirica]
MSNKQRHDDVEVVTGPLGSRKNLLSGAASAYLRSAMHQPVDWMEWGEKAFDRALREDKAILLDIGAVWCHWCHVMDRESYEDAATAELINEHFVAVKVDRDERPDVDTRYQAAVAAISGQGGWPLTAFLTSEGKPFFGGTYFPPQDRHGRPSFRRVLLTMAEAFQNRRSEVEESAGSAVSAIEHNESFSGRSGDPGLELVEKLVLSALQQFDGRSGGFGSQPKFPHSGAIDLLIDLSSRTSANAGLVARAKTAVMVTLDKMSKGGIYDHLAGGFHRYSVDEQWIVPHFEKMAYDNSELLKNYVHGFQTFAEPECDRVARDIMRWMDEWLTDRDLGGFYASQDADFSLDDDGDYFTWTRDEAAEVLTAGELAVAASFYDIGEIGDMHHNVAKNVLHVTETLAAAARAAGVTVGDAETLLASAKAKMYAARKLRPTPYVDKTVYVGWNGMCISAYLLVGRVLHADEATAFALKTLDRVLASAWVDGAMAHVVAYGEGVEGSKRVAGTLEDYVFLGHAALDAWELTGEMRYFDVSEAILRAALDRFYDHSGDAFFDTQAPKDGERVLGALSTRRKPLQDSPTPAGNSVAAALLLRMESLTGKEEYAAKAQATIENFAGVVEHFGLFAASYGLALQRLVQDPIQVCVIGDDEDARRLESVALSRFAVNKSVVRLRKDQLDALPPALAQTLPFLPPMAGSFAVVCSGNVCQPPVSGAEELMEQLNRTL